MFKRSIVLTLIDIAAMFGSYSIAPHITEAQTLFNTRIDYVAGNYPWSVAIGDLDGNGDLDLAVASGGSVSVLINTGITTFGDELALDFSGFGMWNFDGTDWTQISSADVADMEDEHKALPWISVLTVCGATTARHGESLQSGTPAS